MSKKGKNGKALGAMRMVELGWKQLQLWLEPDDFERLREWANAECRTPTNLAKKVLTDAIRNAEFLTNAELARRAKIECENGKPDW